MFDDKFVTEHDDILHIWVIMVKNLPRLQFCNSSTTPLPHQDHSLIMNLHSHTFHDSLFVKIVSCTLCFIVMLLYFPPSCPAAFNDWAEGTRALKDGATRDYYNRAARLEWNNYLGDWKDADGISQGSRPYATADVDDTNTPRFIEWDVTQLVRQWAQGTYPNQGFFIDMISGSGTAVFTSREFADTSNHPQLEITTQAGNFVLTPEADTYLEPSTYISQGDSDILRLRSGGSNIILRFDIRPITLQGDIQSATLKLFTSEQYGSAMVAGVFRCSQGEPVIHIPPKLGIASEYIYDNRISEHQDVIFATGFESDNWKDEWTSANGTIETVSADQTRKFSQLSGKALRAVILEGNNSSMSVIYKFMNTIGYEPEEVYFRYYLRFADDWNQTVYGGKLPGISGTYGRAGWGGRKPDGTDGWSARGTFYLSIGENNPLSQRHPIGTYCYYADQPGTYGDSWPWTKAYKGFLEKNKWYCIEQYVKMNTSGVHNGTLRAWVDGVLAFEKNDILFRTVDSLKIEQIWMNVYHGGTAVSPYDQHLFVDNVVIARKYIGPMNIPSSFPWYLLLAPINSEEKR